MNKTEKATKNFNDKLKRRFKFLIDAERQSDKNKPSYVDRNGKLHLT